MQRSAAWVSRARGVELNIAIARRETAVAKASWLLVGCMPRCFVAVSFAGCVLAVVAAAVLGDAGRV